MDDPTSDYWIFHISIILVSLIFSAFFSGMEIAFLSANRLKMELDKKKGGISDRLISKFAENPKMFIATMLVGNNIALVSYGYFAGVALIELASVLHANLGYNWLLWFIPLYSPWLSLLAQTIITTIFVLFGAEFIPKAIFKNQSNMWLKRFAIPLSIFYYLLWPFAVFVTFISNKLIKIIIKNEEKEERVEFGMVDLDNFLKEAEGNNGNQELDNEIQILQNAIEFSKVKARECMIPRNEILAVDIHTPISEVTKMFVESGFSKIIIYRDNIDNIIGYIHSHELFKKPAQVKNIILGIDVVPEAMLVMDVLEKLIHQRRNITVVLDEFGGTAGILTIEDIVEEIFGEIEDEHDKEKLKEEKHDEHTYIFSARHEIDYLNFTFDLDLPKQEEFDTLSGMIVFFNEDIPKENDVITIDKFDLQIIKVAETHIEEVKLIIKQEEE